MNFFELNDDNIVYFAMKNYNNPSCTGVDEFQEDFNRLKYVKRLLNRYDATGNLRDRLLLNHIIILYNVFGISAATRLLFNRVDEKHYPILKTFLVYLNYCPESKIDGVDLTQLPLDTKIADILRRL